MSILKEINFTVYHDGELHAITATPYLLPVENGMPACFEAKLNGKSIGEINCNKSTWQNENIADSKLLAKIGSLICARYK